MRRRSIFLQAALQKRRRHDDKRQDDKGTDDFRACHEVAVGVQMRMRLLVEIAGIHDGWLPPDNHWIVAVVMTDGLAEINS